MRFFLLVSALLAGPAAAAGDDDFRFRVSTGVGFGFDGAGLQFLARNQEAAIYLGTGVFLLNRVEVWRARRDGGFDLTAGLKFFERASGDGFTMSVDAMMQVYSPKQFGLGVTFGYSWRWEHVFAEVGGGVGLVSLIFISDDQNQRLIVPLPNVNLCIGWEF
jgi:hypothetical protein